MPLPQSKTHTEEDYYALPETVRAELIDGQFYYMAAPSRIHQKILMFLSVKRDALGRLTGSLKLYHHQIPAMIMCSS